MKKLPPLPEVPEEERTPLVKSLLALLEQFADHVRQQAEEIQLLKDEIRILKGETRRPAFKPSNLDKKSDNPTEGNAETGKHNKRPGSTKRSKKAELTIHD